MAVRGEIFLKEHSKPPQELTVHALHLNSNIHRSHVTSCNFIGEVSPELTLSTSTSSDADSSASGSCTGWKKPQRGLPHQEREHRSWPMRAEKVEADTGPSRGKCERLQEDTQFQLCILQTFQVPTGQTTPNRTDSLTESELKCKS